MAIWVIKDGQREGPYQEQDVRELLYEGTYADSDPAIGDGQLDWTTLGRILGRQPPPGETQPGPSTKSPSEPPPFPNMPSSESSTAHPAQPGAARSPARPIQVAIVDFDVPFGSMVMLTVKWAIASIPALLILGMIATIAWVALFAVIVALLHR
jgi:hypothetical protein